MNTRRMHALRQATIHRLAIASLAAGLLVLASGCSTAHDAHEGAMTPSATGSGMASASADAMFAQMMIPHHEQAVVMADLAATRASSPVITELAAEIRAAQQPEIDQMRGWLQEWGLPVLDGGEAMDSHGSHGMSGMLTTAQLDELGASSGPEFDRLFAEYMILHHQGAIDMAQDVLGSADPRVASLASAIISTQETEIGQLQSFLEDPDAG